MSAGEDALVFHLRAVGLPDPVRELRFHPKRLWRFDFAWPDRMLAVEVEGGTWVNGAHSRGRHFEQDAEKYAEAVIAGWRVIRVTTGMVEDGRAVSLIERALA